jgi:nicotinamidase-related amidase
MSSIPTGIPCLPNLAWNRDNCIAAIIFAEVGRVPDGIDLLDPQRTCLLFFDTKRMSVDGPSLKAEDRAPNVVTAVQCWQRQLALARRLRMMVAYALTAQRADQSNYYPRLVDQFQPAHAGDTRRPMSRAALGTPEVEVIDEIAPAYDDYVFWKERFDPFHQTTLELSLRMRQIDTLIVNGGVTQTGICATAYGAHRLDFNSVFVSDGCFTGDPEIQEVLMGEVFPRIGRVRTTDQVLAMLRAGQKLGGASSAG